MNIKKIGMTALAASLVSVSANAAELSVSGGASITANHYSAGSNLNYGGSMTMGNAIVFSGSGELDNGLNVSVSYELDEGAPHVDGGTFDNHSVTVSRDDLGTLVFSGHGGSSAVTKINTTAAGDIWDSFDGTLSAASATGVIVEESGAGDDSFFYTTPSLIDGLAINLSYNPANGTEGGSGATGYGVTYTGVEGLTLSYATADTETGTAATSGDTTAIAAKYAYGPVTVAYTVSEHDEGAASNDQDTTSYSVAYTLSENLSVSYGVEEIESGTTSDQDAEYSKISASYTSGGVTLSAGYAEAENIDYSTDAQADQDYMYLGASFAF